MSKYTQTNKSPDSDTPPEESSNIAQPTEVSTIRLGPSEGNSMTLTGTTIPWSPTMADSPGSDIESTPPVRIGNPNNKTMAVPRTLYDIRNSSPPHDPMRTTTESHTADTYEPYLEAFTRFKAYTIAYRFMYTWNINAPRIQDDGSFDLDRAETLIYAYFEEQPFTEQVHRLKEYQQAYQIVEATRNAPIIRMQFMSPQGKLIKQLTRNEMNLLEDILIRWDNMGVRVPDQEEVPEDYNDQISERIRQNHPSFPEDMSDQIAEVLPDLIRLCREAKKYPLRPDDPNKQQQQKQVAPTIILRFPTVSLEPEAQETSKQEPPRSPESQYWPTDPRRYSLIKSPIHQWEASQRKSNYEMKGIGEGSIERNEGDSKDDNIKRAIILFSTMETISRFKRHGANEPTLDSEGNFDFEKALIDFNTKFGQADTKQLKKMWRQYYEAWLSVEQYRQEANQKPGDLQSVVDMNMEFKRGPNQITSGLPNEEERATLGVCINYWEAQGVKETMTQLQMYQFLREKTKLAEPEMRLVASNMKVAYAMREHFNQETGKQFRLTSPELAALPSSTEKKKPTIARIDLTAEMYAEQTITKLPRVSVTSEGPKQLTGAGTLIPKRNTTSREAARRQDPINDMVELIRAATVAHQFAAQGIGEPDRNKNGTFKLNDIRELFMAQLAEDKTDSDAETYWQTYCDSYHILETYLLNPNMLDNVRNETDGTLLRLLTPEEQASVQNKITYWEYKQIRGIEQEQNIYNAIIRGTRSKVTSSAKFISKELKRVQQVLYESKVKRNRELYSGSLSEISHEEEEYDLEDRPTTPPMERKTGDSDTDSSEDRSQPSIKETAKHQHRQSKRVVEKNIHTKTVTSPIQNLGPMAKPNKSLATQSVELKIKHGKSQQEREDQVPPEIKLNTADRFYGRIVTSKTTGKESIRNKSRIGDLDSRKEGQSMEIINPQEYINPIKRPSINTKTAIYHERIASYKEVEEVDVTREDVAMIPRQLLILGMRDTSEYLEPFNVVEATNNPRGVSVMVDDRGIRNTIPIPFYNQQIKDPNEVMEQEHHTGDNNLWMETIDRSDYPKEVARAYKTLGLNELNTPIILEEKRLQELFYNLNNVVDNMESMQSVSMQERLTEIGGYFVNYNELTRSDMVPNGARYVYEPKDQITTGKRKYVIVLGDVSTEDKTQIILVPNYRILTLASKRLRVSMNQIRETQEEIDDESRYGDLDLIFEKEQDMLQSINRLLERWNQIFENIEKHVKYMTKVKTAQQTLKEWFTMLSYYQHMGRYLVMVGLHNQKQMQILEQGFSDYRKGTRPVIETIETMEDAMRYIRRHGQHTAEWITDKQIIEKWNTEYRGLVYHTMVEKLIEMTTLSEEIETTHRTDIESIDSRGGAGSLKRGYTEARGRIDTTSPGSKRVHRDMNVSVRTEYNSEVSHTQRLDQGEYEMEAKELLIGTDEIKRCLSGEKALISVESLSEIGVLKTTKEDIVRWRLPAIEIRVILEKMIGTMGERIRRNTPSDTTILHYTHVRSILVFYNEVKMEELRRLSESLTKRGLSQIEKLKEEEDWSICLASYIEVIDAYERLCKKYETHSSKQSSDIKTNSAWAEGIGQHKATEIPVNLTTPITLSESIRLQNSQNALRALQQIHSNILPTENEMGQSRVSQTFSGRTATESHLHTPRDRKLDILDTGIRSGISGPTLQKRSYEGLRGQSQAAAITRCIATPVTVDELDLSERRQALENLNNERSRESNRAIGLHIELEIDHIPSHSRLIRDVPDIKQVICKNDISDFKVLQTMINLNYGDRDKVDKGAGYYFPLQTTGGESQIDCQLDRHFQVRRMGLMIDQHFSDLGVQLKHNKRIRHGTCIGLPHGKFQETEGELETQTGYEVIINQYTEEKRPLECTSITYLQLSTSDVLSFVNDVHNWYFERSSGRNVVPFYATEPPDETIYGKVEPNVALKDVTFIFRNARNGEPTTLIGDNADGKPIVSKYIGRDAYSFATIPVWVATRDISPCEFLFCRYNDFVSNARKRLQCDVGRRLRLMRSNENLRPLFEACYNEVRRTGNLSIREANLLQQLTAVMVHERSTTQLMYEPREEESAVDLVQTDAYKQMLAWMGLSIIITQTAREQIGEFIELRTPMQQLLQQNYGSGVPTGGISSILDSLQELHFRIAQKYDEEHQRKRKPSKRQKQSYADDSSDESEDDSDEETKDSESGDSEDSETIGTQESSENDTSMSSGGDRENEENDSAMSSKDEEDSIQTGSSRSSKKARKTKSKSKGNSSKQKSTKKTTKSFNMTKSKRSSSRSSNNKSSAGDTSDTDDDERSVRFMNKEESKTRTSSEIKEKNAFNEMAAVIPMPQTVGRYNMEASVVNALVTVLEGIFPCYVKKASIENKINGQNGLMPVYKVDPKRRREGTADIPAILKNFDNSPQTTSDGQTIIERLNSLNNHHFIRNVSHAEFMITLVEGKIILCKELEKLWRMDQKDMNLRSLNQWTSQASGTEIDSIPLRERAVITYLFRCYCYKFDVEIKIQDYYVKISSLKLKEGLATNLRELWSQLLELYSRLPPEGKVCFGTDNPLYNQLINAIIRVEGTKAKEDARAIKQMIDNRIKEINDDHVDRGEIKESKDSLLSRVIHSIMEDEQKLGNLPSKEDQSDKSYKSNFKRGNKHNSQKDRPYTKSSKINIKDSESISSVSDDESMLSIMENKLKAVQKELSTAQAKLKANSLQQSNHYGPSSNTTNQNTGYPRTCRHCNRSCAENNCNLVAGPDSMYSRQGEIDGGKIAEEAYKTSNPEVTFNEIVEGIKLSARVRRWKGENDDQVAKKMARYEKDVRQWKKIFTSMAPKKK